jgi:holo-[acyl-carrier protein] synthase
MASDADPDLMIRDQSATLAPMHAAMHFNALASPESNTLATPLRVGIDVVLINHIEDSLRKFGQRFVRRLFTEQEAAYAMQSQELAPQRLAARFAAKEAAIKAFGWSEASIDWRDIEVVRADSGACHLQLHGRAAELLSAWAPAQIALSLSHDGNYAVAVVTALPSSSTFPDTQYDHRRH